MKKLLLVVFVLSVVGCSKGDQFSCSSPEELREEFERISATLSSEEAAEFKTAFEELCDLAANDAFFSGYDETRILARFNGKTARDLIDEYRQLSVVARSVSAEIARLSTEAENAGLKETDEFTSAMDELLTSGEERMDRDGEYEGFHWLEEQLAGKTPQQIIAAYSKKQPVDRNGL